MPLAMIDWPFRRKRRNRLDVYADDCSSLLTDVSDLVTVVDERGLRLFVSNSYERMLGYRVRDLIGRSFLEHVHPDDLPEVRAACHSRYHHGGKRSLHVRVRHADGSWRLLQITARRLGGDPAPAAIMITARDETGFEEQHVRLQRAENLEVIPLTTRSVAHDFNNLLAVIGGNLALLQDDRGESPSELIAEAQDAIERAVHLTRQLLAISRGGRPVFEVLNLNDVLTAMHRLARRIVGPSVDVRTRFEPALWQVCAIESEIEQATLNLVVNARDAMPQGGILTISTKNVVVTEPRPTRSGSIPPGDYVCMDVTDTGGGIAADHIDRVFEAYFTTKATIGGTGIGLTTVAGIVDRSNGYVTVESALGRGTRFQLFFPAISNNLQ